MTLAWIIGLALATAMAGRGGVPDEEPDVTVYVESDGPFPGIAVLALAKKTASAMFAGIGVRLVWAAEKMGGAEPAGVVLHVHFTDRPQARLKDTAVAYSHPFAGGAKAITILWDRFQAQCQQPNLAPALLAHIMVQEIAHVLQGIDRHSGTGVMKARWTTDDYHDMLWKQLPFTAYDADLIRLGLAHLRGLSRREIATH